jgi:hypothetical protein
MDETEASEHALCVVPQALVIGCVEGCDGAIDLVLGVE